ncbi:MAG: sulfite exporter TauE/SafE family protein [Thioalkalispiraceae bacterium]|jgi:sulfite exporter TauE/SafE
MPIEISYLSAFLVGLLGGVHCVGMCGGIVSALTLGTSPQQSTPWRYLFAYNLGRISSYTLAGLIVGGLGAQLASLHQLQLGLKVLAGLFMIAMGLYLAGWWFGLTRVEQLGGLFWKRLQPLGSRFIPVQSSLQAVILGSIWGWLPCGLVYSVLIWSLSVHSALDGALLMLAFGLGTLPNLLLIGAVTSSLKGWLQKPQVKVIAGSMVVIFGVYQLYQAVMTASL